MTVQDPAHPLFGRRFRVIRQSVHRGGGFPVSYEVEYRDGVSLLVPAPDGPTSCSCPTSRPAKQFIYFAGATAAGPMPGGRVPIVLTSRAPRRSPRSSSHTHAELDIHTPNRNRRRAFQALTAMLLNAKTTPKMNAIYDRVRLVAQKIVDCSA